MAHLEVIHYTSLREVVEDGTVRWVPQRPSRSIPNLPQIFWDDGEPWHEANHWALTKATRTAGGHIKTVTSLMKHLAAYASWLEQTELDWRHFPVRKEDRAIVQYRGHLIAQRSRMSLAPSTASARMAATIQFYRHALSNSFVERSSPLWQDRRVVTAYYDAAGFKRHFERTVSELAIPNKQRHGIRLEDGLTPLTAQDASTLLEFTGRQSLRELNLMLSLGILTGARIETIATLGVANIEAVYRDPQTPDTFLLRVGPGTGVKTKYDVSGNLMVPRFLVDELKQYAYSMKRLRRQALATVEARGLLFLTSQGNPYRSSSLTRLMTDLRRRGKAAGLRFIDTFKFHQTRATFGTYLMGVALEVADSKTAVAFVRNAMLHKDDKTTLGYIRFLEDAPIKAEVANQFSAAFSGIVNRDWNQYHA